MRGCDFIETQWGHSVLNGVQFLDCCATNGDFTGADIVGCRFESTDMGRTRLEGAVIVDSVFADPRLGSTNLAGANQVFVVVRQCGVNVMGKQSIVATR